MHRAQVVLHVRADVRVGRAERGVAGRHRRRRQANQGDVGDDGAAGQTCRAGGERGEGGLERTDPSVNLILSEITSDGGALIGGRGRPG